MIILIKNLIDQKLNSYFNFVRDRTSFVVICCDLILHKRTDAENTRNLIFKLQNSIMAAKPPHLPQSPRRSQPAMADTTQLIAEAERKKMEQLHKYKQLLNEKMIKIYKEEERNEQEKYKQFYFVNKQICDVFDRITDIVAKRKANLLSTVNDIFNQESDDHEEFLLNIKNTLEKISLTERMCNEGLLQRGETLISDVDQRSEKNCAMIDEILKENILNTNDGNGNNNNNKTERIDYKNCCNVDFDSKNTTSIHTLIDSFGKVTRNKKKMSNFNINKEGTEDEVKSEFLGDYSDYYKYPAPIGTAVATSDEDDNGYEYPARVGGAEAEAEATIANDGDDNDNGYKYPTPIGGEAEAEAEAKDEDKKENERARMIIFNAEAKDKIIDKRKTTFDSGKIYEFGTLTIKKDCVLTVAGWNENTNTGGVLYIKCVNLILEYGSSIDVSGKGYKGGISCHQGYSYKGNPSAPNNNKSNFGGGGAGSVGGLWIGAGGGGGYGTSGLDGYGLGSGKGGICYGDSRLNRIYLGSGGGGTFNFNGTNGGGAIIIECKERILISKNASIIADGENIVYKGNKWSGCGSGGTIRLIALGSIVNNGKISAIGGVNIYKKNSKSGHGGCGRIRIDCKESSKQLLYQGKMELSVGHGRKNSGRFLGGFFESTRNKESTPGPSIKPNVGCLHFIE